MAFRKVILFLFLSIMVFVVSGCTVDSTSFFQRADNDADGIVLIIDGVKYKSLPKTKWSVVPGEVIGYAGNSDTTVQEIEGDTERNFIYLYMPGTASAFPTLYRTDRVIPDPSADTISSMHCLGFEGSQFSANNIIADKQAIQALFDILKAGKHTSFSASLEGSGVQLDCYSGAVPGASYSLNIVIKNGKPFCGNHKEGYVEIPVELLDKIAGYDV